MVLDFEMYLESGFLIGTSAAINSQFYETTVHLVRLWISHDKLDALC